MLAPALAETDPGWRAYRSAHVQEVAERMCEILSGIEERLEVDLAAPKKAVARALTTLARRRGQP